MFLILSDFYSKYCSFKSTGLINCNGFLLRLLFSEFCKVRFYISFMIIYFHSLYIDLIHIKRTFSMLVHNLISNVNVSTVLVLEMGGFLLSLMTCNILFPSSLILISHKFCFKSHLNLSTQKKCVDK